MRDKKLREMEQIADTIRALAQPGMKPKQLIEAVKERHPDAGRKEIARAAFLSIIMSADHSSEDVQVLHDMAQDTRDDEAT